MDGEGKKYEKKREKKWDKNWSQWKNSLGRGNLKGGPCYESPKKEVIFHMFEHLIHNIKTHNRVKI